MLATIVKVDTLNLDSTTCIHDIIMIIIKHGGSMDRGNDLLYQVEKNVEMKPYAQGKELQRLFAESY